jgi:hypothetical protein
MNQDFVNSILSENEQKAVIQFNGSEVMREAVKKILLAGLYRNGVMRAGQPSDALRNAAFGVVAGNTSYNNEELGADLRALWQGINALELAFNEISKFRPAEKVVLKENKAR